MLKFNSKPNKILKEFIRFKSYSEKSHSVCSSTKLDFQGKGNLKSVQEPISTKLSYKVTDNNGLHLIYDTIGDKIDLLAKTKPDKECYNFQFTNTRITFVELKQRVDELAQNLLNLGFSKGDRLALMLPNIPELNITILAAASIGVIVVLLNPAYQHVELEFMLKKTKAKGIIILENTKTFKHYELLTHLCPKIIKSIKGGLVSNNLPDLKHIIVANLHHKYDSIPDKHYKGTWSFGELEKYNLTPAEKPYVDPEDTFALLFTSGTTGLPKAASLTQFSMQNTIYLGSRIHGAFESCRSICSPIPIFHTFGLELGCLSPIVIGNKVTIPHFLPDTLATLKSIHKEEITAINGAPVIFSDILNHPKRNEYDLSSLELALLGASTVPRNLIEKIKKELKIRNIIVGYGMTESSSAGTMTKCSDIDTSLTHAYDSIGVPYPFTECKVVDPQSGKILPCNTDGELHMRGYHIMQGYWNDTQRTSETIDSNRWMKTGDIVSMDEDGYLFFKSRAKEVIIRGGINIYPAEVERFLLSNDAICNVQVFGYPDERNGEEVAAWIKLKVDAKPITGKEILDFCKDKIAYFKIPKYIKFVDSFPINMTGKVQKTEMTTQLLHDLSNSTPVKNLFKLH